MGLLIVNADDFGGNRLANERIVECFAIGAITSATAMVYMDHSEQAAEMARERDLAVGLHLNLTQPFEADAVPEEVRRRQLRVSAHLARRRHRYMFDPALFGEVRRCIEDQLRRFVEIFERQPTHLDGHNHGHLSPTALMALPRGVAVRTAESEVGAGPIGKLVRTARHRLITRRQQTTDYFFAISRLQPERLRSPAGDEPLLELARTATVEIMAHPDRDGDYRLLSSAAWLRTLEDLPTGSYARLGEGREKSAAAQKQGAHRSVG
ncbi:MAG TPA: ChbG/HpnK family deacetylase [Solirubrobacteraceae bacterium]|nr:ChbG/HpnK family deacetylase [Solirubrobacteraceae bacterium]